MMKHNLVRTSPKGEKFIGSCCLCGKDNLTLLDKSECENVVRATNDESIMKAIKGEQQ